jgi:hypothetical protein
MRSLARRSAEEYQRQMALGEELPAATSGRWARQEIDRQNAESDLKIRCKTETPSPKKISA